MKTPAVPRRSLTAVPLVAVLLFLPPMGRAADKTAAPKNVPQSTRPETEGYDLWIADDGVFVYRGKQVEPTLGNVVDALRERYTDANIALAPGLATLKISDLKLRASQLSDELEALRRRHQAGDRSPAEADHLRMALEETLDELDPEDRRLIEGKYLEGSTIQELAAASGLTDKAVESRLLRLRRQLRERLLKKLHDS